MPPQTKFLWKFSSPYYNVRRHWLTHYRKWARARGLVNRIWLGKLRIRGALTKKIRIGFGPVTTGEHNLAERKWRIDPIINQINQSQSPYFASCFFDSSEMKNFDLIVIVKFFHRSDIAWISKLKQEGKKFIYDIVDNPNAAQPHDEYFAQCPEFAELMDAFILSSPVQTADASQHTSKYTLIEHPVINRDFKKEYSDKESIQILAHGYYQNLLPIRALEPVLQEIAKEIEKPIRLIYHSETVRPNTENTQFLKWTRRNSFKTLPLADIAITLRDFSQPFQSSKPSTKLLTLMAAGLPVVCTPSEADKLVLEENRTALTAFDQAQWKEKIKSLCLDSELRERIGKSARASAIKNYSVERITEKYLDLFKRLEGVSCTR